MTRKIHLETSPTGVQHSVEIDSDGDGFYAVEHTPSSVENEILDECSRLRALHQRGRVFQHAAKIPINTYMAWKKEWREHYSDVFTWQTFEVMKLNSRDFKNLRTGYKRSGSKRL